VTICDSGNQCKTIDDILLDTGSYGLRVFSSVLEAAPALNLSPITAGGLPVAECVQYGDGSKQWGPVKRAKVKLGGEDAVDVPIQVVDAQFTGMSSKCSNSMTSPTDGGFNGILGLGLFQHDCGLNCWYSANNSHYYACDASSGTCDGTKLRLLDQVQNPVALLPVDHNGVILKLPDIDSTGEVSVEGYLVLGIGTRENNQPDSNLKTFTVDPGFGEFITEFNGAYQNSFIDSGSNSLAFPYSGEQLSECASPLGGWFCPGSPTSLSAVTLGSNGASSGSIGFEVGSFLQFYQSPNYVSKTIAGRSSSGVSGLFDWGLPFYFGRNVYHGIEGQSSPLGPGPYWAY